MRKDVKLGFAIGGVLLAVLIVYVLVISGGTEAPGPVTLTTEDSTQTQAPAVNPQPELSVPPAVGQTQGNAGSTAAAPAPQPPVAADNTQQSDRWSSILHEGLPTMLTVTPTPTPAVTPLPAQAQANAEAIPGGTTSAQLPRTGANLRADPVDPFVNPTTAPGVPQTYTIRSGDTFSSLAARFYGNAAYYPHIVRANPGLDSSKLRLGAVIKLPPASAVIADGPAATIRPTPTPAEAAPVDSKTQYQVQPGDNLYNISMKLYGKADQSDKLYELNKSTIGSDPAKLKIGMVLKLPESPTSR